jgi:hypothetical protein
MMLICGALFGGFWSGLSTVLVSTFQAGVPQWVVWRRRWSGLDHYDEGCARSVRLFGVVDLTGGFGTFIAILQLPLLLSECLLVIVLVLWMVLTPSVAGSVCSIVSERFGITLKPNDSAFRSGYKVLKGMFENFATRMGTIETERPIRWMDRLFVFVGVGSLATSIGLTEATLRLNQIQVDHDLLSTGQLLPLVIGVVGILSVFVSWLDDRMEEERKDEGVGMGTGEDKETKEVKAAGTVTVTDEEKQIQGAGTVV